MEEMEDSLWGGLASGESSRHIPGSGALSWQWLPCPWPLGQHTAWLGVTLACPEVTLGPRGSGAPDPRVSTRGVCDAVHVMLETGDGSSRGSLGHPR